MKCPAFEQAIKEIKEANIRKPKIRKPKIKRYFYKSTPEMLYFLENRKARSRSMKSGPNHANLKTIIDCILKGQNFKVMYKSEDVTEYWVLRAMYRYLKGTEGNLEVFKQLILKRDIQ